MTQWNAEILAQLEELRIMLNTPPPPLLPKGKGIQGMRPQYVIIDEVQDA